VRQSSPVKEEAGKGFGQKQPGMGKCCLLTVKNGLLYKFYICRNGNYQGPAYRRKHDYNYFIIKSLDYFDKISLSRLYIILCGGWHHCDWGRFPGSEMDLLHVKTGPSPVTSDSFQDHHSKVALQNLQIFDYRSFTFKRCRRYFNDVHSGK
jgi:hypothetical protein